MVANRAYIEKLIYDAFTALDPTETNTNKYKALFSQMDDKKFESFFKNFLKNDQENFTLDIVELEHTISMEMCEKCAKVLDIPLMEYVYQPHLNKSLDKVIVSKEKCLVGYLNVKRPQQMVFKKNGISVTNEKRSALTNQVTGSESKNSRDSDIEAAMLVALGAENILQELHGPRADDFVMRREMATDIKTKGYSSLDDMTNMRTNKVTLNTVNTYLLSMGIHSDLVSSTYILPKTSMELFDTV